MNEILIVDDEAPILETLKEILEDENYGVYTASNGEDAEIALFKHTPQLILLDIWLPDVDGITLLRRWQERFRCPIVMMSGHGTIETAVEATKLGAYDFLEKPLSTAKLLLTVERALQAAQLKDENERLRKKIDPPRELIGNSPKIQLLKHRCENLISQKYPLLITGDSGTGKEHFARYLHQRRRMRGIFVYANLAVIEQSDSLVHFVQQAQSGTLYINEINVLTPEQQGFIMHLIDHGEYVVNGEIFQSDLQLIVGSRVQLAGLKTYLRPHFFDWISIANIELPRLNQHSEDIPELLNYFSQILADSEGLPYRHFNTAAQNYLRQQTWNGNVRELRQLVQRLLIMGGSSEISLDEAQNAFIPLQQSQDERWAQVIPLDLSFRDARDIFERHYLLEQFRRCDGNIAKLSQLVGMDRTNLYRKLRSVGIEPTQKPD